MAKAQDLAQRLKAHVVDDKLSGQVLKARSSALRASIGAEVRSDGEAIRALLSGPSCLAMSNTPPFRNMAERRALTTSFRTRPKPWPSWPAASRFSPGSSTIRVRVSSPSAPICAPASPTMPA